MKEQQAKSILVKAASPEHWFGVEYTVNLYRGCTHGCVYCDSRSECYGIEDFEDVTVKINGPELLRRELSRKRSKALIGTGAMSDPYIPAERGLGLTRSMLEIIREQGFSVHMVTKSDLVLRDLDLLTEIGRNGVASVAFTVTTCDPKLAAWAEPYAPVPAARLAAMKRLADSGVDTGILLMPVLPFLMDTPQQVLAVAEQARLHGARYVVPWFGMTLRDRQRDYYYGKLQERSPGLKERYIRTFGQRYSCSSPAAGRLSAMLEDYCRTYGMGCRMADAIIRLRAKNKEPEQLELF